MENSSQHDHQHSHEGHHDHHHHDHHHHHEGSEELRKEWDERAEHYNDFGADPHFQSFACLCVHTGVQNRSRILEVGCGTGQHSLFVGKTMLKDGGVIVCTDLSKKMIEIVKRKVTNEKYGFVAMKDSYAFVNTEDIDLTQKIDIESEIPKYVKEKNDKLLYSCIANNENLPFKDESFDCYLSSCSLMLVDNYKNQISESFRVLQKGGMLGLSLVGRFENHKMMANILTAAKQNGLIADDFELPFFKLGKDLAWLKKEFESYGFTQVRVWYQPMQFTFGSFDEYFKFTNHFHFADLHAKGEKVFNQFRSDLEELYNKTLSTDVVDYKSNEVAIVIAKKPE